MVKGVIDDLPSLRDPAPLNRELLASKIIDEWLCFEKGLGQEHLAPFFRFVGEILQAIDIPLDGQDRDQPWSAAAISFVVRKASATVAKYKRFKFAMQAYQERRSQLHM